MTTTEQKKPQKLAFKIYQQDAEGNLQRVGSAFRHNKGDGMNIVIGDTRYVAFPPKAWTAPGESA